jgi:heme/copper-type cytochrome/quinol oxidase subunit 3
MTFMFWFSMMTMTFALVTAYKAQKKGDVAGTIFFTVIMVLVYLDLTN